MYLPHLLSILSKMSLLAYTATAYARIGGYKVLLCDDNHQAERLSFYIPHISTNICKVLADINLGTNSPHGFSAFFKSNNSKARVAKLFHDIALGTPISFAADEDRSRCPAADHRLHQPWRRLHGRDPANLHQHAVSRGCDCAGRDRVGGSLSAVLGTAGGARGGGVSAGETWCGDAEWG